MNFDSDLMAVIFKAVKFMFIFKMFDKVFCAFFCEETIPFVSD